MARSSKSLQAIQTGLAERPNAMKWLCTTLAMMTVASSPAAAFDLQGHRGARGLAPENTIPAFAEALAIGVTTLELDVAVTKDGVLVVHHDERLDPNTTRSPDGRFPFRARPGASRIAY